MIKAEQSIIIIYELFARNFILYSFSHRNQVSIFFSVFPSDQNGIVHYIFIDKALQMYVRTKELKEEQAQLLLDNNI